MSSLACSQDNGDGWYLQGDPAITKDKEIDLPPCYTGRTVTVTNGEGHGSQTYSAECFKEGYGTYSSSVTWTKPPAYMKPGSNISFSMTFTSPDGKPTGGAIKANGGTIVEGDSRNPQGNSTATYTVPKGSPGNELELYTSFVMISGLHGYVTYKYKYQVAGTSTVSVTQPAAPERETSTDIEGEATGTRSSKTFDPRSLKPRTGFYINNFYGDVYVIRDGMKIPATKGFQLREGDAVKTLYGFAKIVLPKTLFDGPCDLKADVGPDRIFYIYSLDKNDIKKIEEREGNFAFLVAENFMQLEAKDKSEEMERKYDEAREKKMEAVNRYITMKYGTAEILHTLFVCEQTSDASILKVLNGTVKFTSNVTGEEILLNDGQMVTATATGLSPLESFDVGAEKAKWKTYLPTTLDTEPKESKVIYDSWNLDSVDNNPTCSPFFTTAEPQMITYIDTYHWNYGTGAPGGTISLRNGDGTLYGPWEAESAIDQGEVPRGYWIAHPNEVIPAGTYTVEDSDPATWSQNSESPCGFTKIEGYATSMDASEETGALATGIKEPVSSATSAEGISHQPAETDTADTGIKGEQGLGSTAQEEASYEKTIPHSIDETISSAIKRSSTAAKQEPATIEKSTYSTVSARPLEIRSQVATGDFEWNPQNFAGFYYDLNQDVGTELLTATVSDGKLSGSYPYGLSYQTTSQKNDFAFEDWGSYNVIGFMGEKYFAGYIDIAGRNDDRLFEESGDENVLSDNKLLNILVDDDTEMTITTDKPLTLEDGYMLFIDSIDIDGNVVTLTLSKDGAKLMTKKISPSRDGATMADRTFIYRKKIGNSRDVVIVAVHLKNAFRGADQDLATVDGMWQLSDEALDVSDGTKYDKMTIQTITADSITMNNEDNDVTLSKNKHVSLMPGIGIKTADADSLRYYVYKEITQPGKYEIRGTVATDRYAWTADNFAGFYYDIDDDIETESLRTTITDGKLAQPDGVTYTTGTMTTNFEFEDWGSYKVIGFLGERCFAEYVRGVDSLGYNDLESDSEKGYLFDKSTDKSALDKEQLLKILADHDTEKTVTTDTPLKLEEGYELAIKSISFDGGNNVYLELSKNGDLVHSAIIHPSQDNATMADKTYIYKEDMGDLKNMVVIAVHFKNAFRGADQNLATVDGVWQISNSPISVKGGASFGKLVISDIAYGQISMKNKDNPITLSKNKYVSLAGDMYIKTADSDSLRYYIVKET
ncbi:MAG: S-layer protein domain-containing protein [Methanothrix sp.]